MVVRNKIEMPELQTKANAIYKKAIADCKRWRIPISQRLNDELILISRNTCYAITYKDEKNDAFVICLSMLTKNTYERKNLDEAIYNFMLHELCHTIPDCFNHGREWKKWIRLLNKQHHAKLNTKPYSLKPHESY